MWGPLLHLYNSSRMRLYHRHCSTNNGTIFYCLILMNALVLAGVSHSANGQLRNVEKGWSIQLQGGLSGYYGDLSPREGSLLKHYFSGLQEYAGFGIEKRLSGHVLLSANLTRNRLYGSDFRFSPSGSTQYLRNLHFRNEVYSFFLSAQWDFIPLFRRYSYRKRLRPYLAIGIGGLLHNPQARAPISLGGAWQDLRPLGTEGQLLNGGEPYAKINLSVPLELGLNIRLTNWLDIVPHFRFHLAFTDYLDDVSGSYVDAGLLSSPLSKALSDRSSEMAYPETGELRELPMTDAASYIGADGISYRSYHGIPQGASRGDNLPYDGYWSAGIKLRVYLSGSANPNELSKLYKLNEPIDPNDKRRRIIPNEWVKSKERHHITRLAINTPYSETVAAFYQDGFIIDSDRPNKYNSRRRKHGKYYNLYYTPFADLQRGEITKPILFSDDSLALSKKNILQACPMQAQGKSAFFCVGSPLSHSRPTEKYQLYQADITANLLWEQPKPVQIDEWPYSVTQPYFSTHRDTLYFVSDAAIGRGGTDIYFTVKGDSTWQKPQNLGKEINTSGDELYPFVHKDGTMYFASDGHKGFGGLDIFEAQRDTTAKYIVTNLGSPINSKKQDFGLILDRVKRNGYFSSDRDGGEGSTDVYAVSVVQLSESRNLTDQHNLVRERLVTVEGILLDSISKRPVPNAYITVLNEITQKVRVVRTNDKGLFHFQASNDGLYQIAGNAFGYERLDSRPLEEIGVENSLTGDFEIKLEVVPKQSRIMTVKGIIRTESSQKPIKGATVELSVKGESHTKSKVIASNASGEYDFKLQRNLTYILTATKEGFMPISYELSTFNRISQRIIVNLRMERAAE